MCSSLSLSLSLPPSTGHSSTCLMLCLSCWRTCQCHGSRSEMCQCSTTSLEPSRLSTRSPGSQNPSISHSGGELGEHAVCTCVCVVWTGLGVYVLTFSLGAMLITCISMQCNYSYSLLPSLSISLYLLFATITRCTVVR